MLNVWTGFEVYIVHLNTTKLLETAFVDFVFNHFKFHIRECENIRDNESERSAERIKLKKGKAGEAAELNGII